MQKYLLNNADDFLEALANTDKVELFSSVSIRSIIEIKWPLIRTAIVRKMFIPYVIFVFTFLIYSVYIFENLNPRPGTEDKD